MQRAKLVVLLLLCTVQMGAATPRLTDAPDLGRFDERLENLQHTLGEIKHEVANLVNKENNNAVKLQAFIGDRETGPVLMQQYKADMQDIRLLRGDVAEMKTEVKVRGALEMLVVVLLGWALNAMRVRLKVKQEGDQ